MTLTEFLEEAKFTNIEQRRAVLKLLLLTGLSNSIDKILAYVRTATELEKDDISSILQQEDRFKERMLELQNRIAKNNFLAELKNLNKEEINQYLTKHPVEEIFNFIGKEMTSDEFNQILVAFTQVNWFARRGERWEELSSLLTELDGKDEIKNILKETGVYEENLEFPQNNPVAIFGTVIPSMQKRLNYAISNIGNLENRKVSFLVGNRFINESERQIPEILINAQKIANEKNIAIPKDVSEITETLGAMVVVEKTNEERKIMGLPTIAVKFVDTDKVLNFEEETPARPNTEATVRQFLLDTVDDEDINSNNIKDKNINNTIFISNGPNIKAQEIAVNRVLMENDFKNYSVIVRGEPCTTETKNSTILGTLAGRMYGSFTIETQSNCLQEKTEIKVEEEEGEIERKAVGIEVGIRKRESAKKERIRNNYFSYKNNTSKLASLI